MAEWKKVIVSGSVAQLAAVSASTGILVGTNQQIGTSQTTTFLTGSFTGSFKGDGAGLLNVTATAIFPTTAKTDLTSTDQIYVNDGANKYITYGNLLTDLAGTNLTVESSDSLTLSSTISGLTSVSATTFTGNLTGTASWASNAVSASYASTAGSALSATSASYASTAPYSGLIGVPSGIVSGSALGSSNQGEVYLTTNGVAASAIDLGLQTTDTPTFAGLTLTNGTTATISTGGTTMNVFNTTATTVNAFGAATAINIGAATGTTTINNSLSVLGNMYVQGSVTAVSSSNLYVADQFILLASGSATNTDGGIIIDRGSYAAGNIGFGYDATTGRWGLQDGITDTTNAIDPTSASGVSGSFIAHVFTEASHGATKPLTGEFAVAGAIYTNTDGTVWIYA